MKTLSEFSQSEIEDAIKVITKKSQIKPLPKADLANSPLLFVFRHGQSEDNQKYLFSGWRNSPLTKLGEEQAQILAEKMKDLKIDLAISSNLDRAKETLAIVLQNHPNTPIETTDDIIERSYGDLQGTSKVELYLNNPELEEKYRRAYDFPPPNGESLKMVEIRVKRFLDGLLPRIKKENINVAVSCHSNSMREIRKIMENLTEEETCHLEDPLAQDFVSYHIK